jgi:curved DNA-binding protein CbpA
MGELMETIDVLSDPDYREWFNHSRYHRGVKALPIHNFVLHGRDKQFKFWFPQT